MTRLFLTRGCVAAMLDVICCGICLSVMLLVLCHQTRALCRAEDLVVDDLSMPKEQEGGKALYAVFCRQRGLGIHVHRTHLQPARVLLDELDHLRSHHPARAAPGRPEVDEYGQV